jgi:hypothetical protein
MFIKPPSIFILKHQQNQSIGFRASISLVSESCEQEQIVLLIFLPSFIARVYIEKGKLLWKKKRNVIAPHAEKLLYYTHT